MSKFEVEKLVRDEVAAHISSNKLAKTDYVILNNQELIPRLIDKLVEEATELQKTNIKDRNDILNEIADVETVLDCLKEKLNITEEEIKKVKDKKIEKLGSFKKRIFLKTVELEESDSWLPYYQEKYKEIK